MSDFVNYVSDDLDARATLLKPSVEAKLPRARFLEDLRWQVPKRENESVSNFVEKLEDLAKSPDLGASPLHLISC